MEYNSSLSFNEQSQIPSDEVTAVLVTANLVFINVIFAILGICSNIINVLVFSKQGCKDNVNISLFALAVAELGSLIFGLLYSLCTNEAFAATISPLDASDFKYLVSIYPRNVFGRIISAVTAFITFERCICVLLPFKVKRLMTARVTLSVMAFIYACLAATLIPVYLILALGWKFDAARNKTIIGVVETGYSGPADINNAMTVHVYVHIISYTVSIVCTAILIAEIRGSYKWRKATASSAAHATKAAQKKVTKTTGMLAMMSSVYIVCYSPGVAVLTIVILFPNYGDLGRFQNLFNVVKSFNFVLESFNTTIGVFLYYNMSVNYRTNLIKIFSWLKMGRSRDSFTQ